MKESSGEGVVLADGTRIRAFRSWRDYDHCVVLQEEVWGKGYLRIVPPMVLKISQMVGGIAAGAFEPDGDLAGFIFGVSGFRDGRPLHWSHMCAVRRTARDRGLGRELKSFQRSCLLDAGIDTAYWTFDPLEARNAHLNLNRLGAEVDRYERDFYPEDFIGKRGSGIGTDRLVVRWDLRSARVERALSRAADADEAVFDSTLWQAAPRLDLDLERDLGEEGVAGRADSSAGRLRLQIPEEIQRLKSTDLEAGKAWRQRVRRGFDFVLGRGYRVEGFLRLPADGVCDYLCSKLND